MWILRSTDESNPLTIRLTAGAVKTVGRGPIADFVVNTSLVSRVHCQFSVSATGLKVEDLKSTNGTFVNDQRVEQSSLQPGDRLRLGRFELTVLQKQPHD